MKKSVNRREFIGQMALGAAGILASGCAASSALTLKDTATPTPTPKPVAQAAPTPSPMIAELGDVKLESGQVLKDTRVGYMTKGTLNADASNAVVVFTALTRASPTIMGREVFPFEPDVYDYHRINHSLHQYAREDARRGHS